MTSTIQRTDSVIPQPLHPATPSALWIKICGLTTHAGVEAAVDAGADAIGFVFAPSKRQVTPAGAAELARGAPKHIARIAVMLHPSQALVNEVWEIFRPDVLQTDIGDLDSLLVPPGLQTLPVVRIAWTALASPPPRLLFEGPVSGAGEASDWAAAEELGRMTQLVLAGGLTPANVREAVARTRPFGVDVSSGVEAQPGLKDPIKIREFVRNARAGAS